MFQAFKNSWVSLSVGCTVLAFFAGFDMRIAVLLTVLGICSVAGVTALMALIESDK